MSENSIEFEAVCDGSAENFLVNVERLRIRLIGLTGKSEKDKDFWGKIRVVGTGFFGSSGIVIVSGKGGQISIQAEDMAFGGPCHLRVYAHSKELWESGKDFWFFLCRALKIQGGIRPPEEIKPPMMDTAQSKKLPMHKGAGGGPKVPEELKSLICQAIIHSRAGSKIAHFLETTTIFDVVEGRNFPGIDGDQLLSVFRTHKTYRRWKSELERKGYKFDES